MTREITSWEQEAVDEIIALETRAIVLQEELNRTEELYQIARALNLNTAKLQQRGEELESELWDVLNALEK